MGGPGWVTPQRLLQLQNALDLTSNYWEEMLASLRPHSCPQLSLGHPGLSNLSCLGRAGGCQWCKVGGGGGGSPIVRRGGPVQVHSARGEGVAFHAGMTHRGPGLLGKDEEQFPFDDRNPVGNTSGREDLRQGQGPLWAGCAEGQGPGVRTAVPPRGGSSLTLVLRTWF